MGFVDGTVEDGRIMHTTNFGPNQESCKNSNSARPPTGIESSKLRVGSTAPVSPSLALDFWQKTGVALSQRLWFGPTLTLIKPSTNKTRVYYTLSYIFGKRKR